MAKDEVFRALLGRASFTANLSRVRTVEFPLKSFTAIFGCAGLVEPATRLTAKQDLEHDFENRALIRARFGESLCFMLLFVVRDHYFFPCDISCSNQSTNFD